MVATRSVHWVAILALVGGGFVSQAAAQETRPAAGGMAEWLRARGIQMTPEQIEQARKMMEDLRNGVQVDPEQIQKMVGDIRKQVQAGAQARIKETLGATDAEWKVLEPKVQKVQDLILQEGYIGMGMARMGMGRVNIGPGAQQSDVQKKRLALQEVVQKEDASAEEIRVALKDYRDAVDKAKEELAKARAQLRELLTVRQEALLVLMGLLE